MSLFSAQTVSWPAHFGREMAPSPGRLAGTLRFSLATALATLLMLILQPAAYTIAPSLFMLFLLSHDAPNACLKDVVIIEIFAAIATATVLGLVIATDNDPMARVLGLALCTFLATFFFRASTYPIAALAFGCVSFMIISLWSNQIRDEKILHLSLWPMSTLFTVGSCAVLVDYLFHRSNPALELQREMKARFQALEQLFQLCASGADAELFNSQSSKVRRYSVTGQGRMHLLLERISKQHPSGVLAPEQLSTVISMLIRLLDLGSAFDIHISFEGIDRARLERITKALAAARDGHMEQITGILGDSPTRMTGEIDRFEQTLHNMGEALEQYVAKSNQAVPGAQSKRPRQPWFVPDAFTNPVYLAYGLKLSLCATICYVVYNALKWPEISTAYFTVLFTGLTTTGATNRKLAFRFIGSTFGGLILGLGCLVFVFPNIDSVTPFLLVIAAVSFLGAWVARSSYFGYIGLQITFSFNLLAFEGFSAPTQMTPARDRLLGITLGLIVMLLIFHQVDPERTVDTMRRTLARLLRAEAKLVLQMNLEPPDAIPSVEAVAVREGISSMVAAMQSFAEVVKFEFEPDRTGDMRISEGILNAVSSSTDLLLSMAAWPEHTGTRLSDARLSELRKALDHGLRDLASSLEHVPGSGEEARQLSEKMLDGLQIMESKSVEKTFVNFRELHMLCESIVPA